MDDIIKVVCYFCGTLSCFAGLILYGHDVEFDGSVRSGAVLIVVGVILLLFTYPND